MKTTKISLLALIALFAFVVLTGCSDDDSPVSPTTKTRTELLTEAIENAVGDDLPGVAVRILGPDIDYTAAAGVADLSDASPMSADHRFHVASTGKMFIGAAAARLAAVGAIDLDATLAEALPELADRLPSSDTITLLHLLQQTSGLIDVLNDIDDVSSAIEMDPTHVWTNAELVTYAYDKPLHFAPGAAWAYSNTNFMLAAMILESAVEVPSAQILRDLFFDPLNMTGTSTASFEPLTGTPAHGYLFDGDDAIDATEVALNWNAGSGGQWSTVDDLTRFLHGFVETDVVANDLVREIFATPSAHGPYGLGVFVVDSVFGPMVGHGGLFVGYSTTTGYFLDHGVTIVVCGNAQGQVNTAENLFAAVRNIVFEN